MKIFLLNPFGRELNSSSRKIASKYFEEPLGLMYIYSYLKKYLPNHELKIFDASLLLEKSSHTKMGPLWDELELEIRNFGPDIAGISALYYSNAEIVDKTAALVKSVNPATRVIVGGSYPSHLPGTALETGNIDLCVLSEGEQAFCELIEAIESESSFDNIDGIAYMDQTGKLQVNGKKKYIEDLDSIPPPDREVVDFDQYLSGGRRALYRYYDPDELKIASVTSTRGCPCKCAFCGSRTFWGMRIRYRTPEKVIEEMLEMQEVHGVNTFVFNDDNQTVNTKHFNKVLDLIIQQLPGIRWLSGGGLNVRAINNSEIIQKMYQSGICLFNIAVESGSNETLKKVHKPVTVEESENVVKLIRQCGEIPICAFFVIGFPFETIDDINITTGFAKKLNLDWSAFSNFQPVPGTELYQYCLDKKLIDKFDLNYGENYLPSNIRYKNFTSEDVSRLNYDANIDINFINNRNIKLNPKRAIGDFDYVLSLVDNHHIATYCKALAYRNEGDEEHAGQCLSSIKEQLTEDNLFYKYFVKYDLLNTL